MHSKGTLGAKTHGRLGSPLCFARTVSIFAVRLQKARKGAPGERAPAWRGRCAQSTTMPRTRCCRRRTVLLALGFAEPATAPLSTRARGRRVGSSRPSRRGDGGSFSSPAFRATSTSRYSATTSSASSASSGGSSRKSSSSEKPESDPRSIPAHSSSRNLADASSTSPGWTTKGFGSFASRSSPGGETTGARMAGVRGGTTAVASPGAATAAGDTGARHDACVSMAAGMHRVPAE